MFNNIGKKIKTLAVVLCWIGIALSIIGGFILMTTINRSAAGFFLGILESGLGFLASWIGSFLLYGFGELIDKTADIERNTRPHTAPTATSWQPYVNQTGSTNPPPVKQASTCIFCGHTLESFELFCPKCGQKKN